MQKQLVVIDSTVGAADATMNNRILLIKNCPPINFIDLVNVGQGWLPSLIETSDLATVSFTATATTDYAIEISQWNDYLKKQVIETVPFTSDSTGAGADIVAGFVAYINKKTAAGQWFLTATSVSSTSFSIVGTTGHPLFFVRPLRNTSVTQGLSTIAPHGTAGTALAGTSTVTVTTLAAHGLVVGQSVSISTATGYTFTRDGVATVAYINNAIIATVPSSTTFTLFNVTGSGTNTGAIVITPQAQAERGTYADLLSQGVSSSLISVGATYASMFIKFFQDVNPTGGIRQKEECTLRLFIKDGISNIATFKSTLIAHLQNNTGGVSNTEALAVTG